jgi:hypothetical protein
MEDSLSGLGLVSRVILGFIFGCILIGLPISAILSMFSQASLSLTVIGGVGFATAGMVLVDNTRGTTDDSTSAYDGIVTDILGENFRQGAREVRGKTPTMPSQAGNKTHQKAQKQAEGARQEIKPETLLSGMGASNCPVEIIEDEEEIQYLVQSVDLEVDGENQGSLGYGLVTDYRIVVAAGNLSFSTTEISSQHSISYRDISDVSIGNNMLTTTLKIRTPGHTYEITGVDGETATTMAEYIRKKMWQRDNVISGDEKEDSLDKLERLSDLREKGAVTEAEYERKKSELMDDI